MKEQWQPPKSPLEEYREHTQELSKLVFLAKHGGQVERERLCNAFADAFIGLDNLMDDFGITMREIFLGNDVDGSSDGF